MLQPSDPPRLVSGTASAASTSQQQLHQTQQQYSYPQSQGYQQHEQYGGAPVHVAATTHHNIQGGYSASLSGPGYSTAQGQATIPGGGGAGVVGSERPNRAQRPSLWKWVSMKEVVFIFLACSIAAALFRVRDATMFQLAWEEKMDTQLYRNGKFPLNSEKLYVN